MGSADALKAAFRSCPSAVAVITTDCDRGPLGMTVSSLVSLSLDPPLVCWNTARNSLRTSAFVEARHVGVHVIGEDQAHVATAFARRGLEPFQELDHEIDANGVPRLIGCSAALSCIRRDTMDGGDHVILLAEVIEVEVSDKPPLAWLGGAFCSLSRLPVPKEDGRR